MDFKIWPVWNVADLCIVSGVAILAWTLWRSETAEVANEPATPDQ
jgi:lipoprotein signal peptidase